MTLEVFPLWMLFKDFEVPLGSIVMWPVHNNIPSGWRICDGSSLSRTTYNELWAQIQLTYTSGDDGSTFNIPNLTNTFIKGTSPAYDQSSKSYTWAGRDVPGTPEAEEFNHSLVTPVVTPTISLSSYSTQVSYQITTNNTESHSHGDAVPEEYRYTTEDNADENIAGHDLGRVPWDRGSGTKHLPGPAVGYQGSGDPAGGAPGFRQYGSFFMPNGAVDSNASIHPFGYIKRWYHNHPTTNTNNSGFARDGIDTQNHGTTLVQGGGAGQMAQGTGSVGAHTHDVEYTLDRTHNHSISSQQGNIQMSGFGSKIEPKHMPIVYIIYTGVN